MSKKDSSNSSVMTKGNNGSEEPHTDTAERNPSPIASNDAGLNEFAVGPSPTPWRAPTSDDGHLEDEYNPENLRIEPENQAVANKLLLVVRTRKPGKREWWQIHPDPAYSFTAALFQEEDGESMDKETFLIHPTARAYFHDNEYGLYSLHVYITTQGNLGIWPIRLPDERKNDWITTSLLAVESGKKVWTRIAANMKSRLNDVFDSPPNFPKPVWPDKSMWELIQIGFRDHIIKTEDHPMILKLRKPML